MDDVHSLLIHEWNIISMCVLIWHSVAFNQCLNLFYYTLCETEYTVHGTVVQLHEYIMISWWNRYIDVFPWKSNRICTGIDYFFPFWSNNCIGFVYWVFLPLHQTCVLVGKSCKVIKTNPSVFPMCWYCCNPNSRRKNWKLFNFSWEHA